jgi:hypothetical protein
MGVGNSACVRIAQVSEIMARDTVDKSWNSASSGGRVTPPTVSGTMQEGRARYMTWVWDGEQYKAHRRSYKINFCSEDDQRHIVRSHILPRRQSSLSRS